MACLQKLLKWNEIVAVSIQVQFRAIATTSFQLYFQSKTIPKASWILLFKRNPNFTFQIEILLFACKVFDCLCFPDVEQAIALNSNVAAVLGGGALALWRVTCDV
jgi:hypothetical protein